MGKREALSHAKGLLHNLKEAVEVAKELPRSIRGDITDLEKEISDIDDFLNSAQEAINGLRSELGNAEKTVYESCFECGTESDLNYEDDAGNPLCDDCADDEEEEDDDE